MSNKNGLDIPVLYEDDDCLVVSKPAGLMVHPDGRDSGPFLTDWVVETYPEAKGVGEPGNSQDGSPLNRSGIVHRLDRETSGALIVAKTQKGYEHLKKQFQGRNIQKMYNAFVWGEVRENFGTISRPIGRSSGDFRKWSAQRGARGDMREAETYWTRVVSSTVGPSADSRFTYLEVEPKTGRTHQIRVHLNAINHPVVGDSLYAPKRPMALGFDRLALHSRRIKFKTTAGKGISVEAPLPNDFISACDILGVAPRSR